MKASTGSKEYRAGLDYSCTLVDSVTHLSKRSWWAAVAIDQVLEAGRGGDWRGLSREASVQARKGATVLALFHT